MSSFFLFLSLSLSLFFLFSQGCRTLLATHFHELTETLSNRYDEIGSYYTIAQPWTNGEIILTYKIGVREREREREREGGREGEREREREPDIVIYIIIALYCRWEVLIVLMHYRQQDWLDCLSQSYKEHK